MRDFLIEDKEWFISGGFPEENMATRHCRYRGDGRGFSVILFDLKKRKKEENKVKNCGHARNFLYAGRDEWGDNYISLVA